MNVFIQLTSAGTNTDFFNLYSDVDGYTTPFEQNVSKNKLLLGFTSVLVPNSTTIIKVVEVGDCMSYIYLTISIPPTTTTTTSTTTSTTSTTTTTTSSSTTTTTTTEPPVTTTTTTTTSGLTTKALFIARSLTGHQQSDVTPLCGKDYNDMSAIDINSAQVVYYQSAISVPAYLDYLFVDQELTIPFLLSDDTWWGAVTNWNANLIYDYSLSINEFGRITEAVSCSTVTTTTTIAPTNHLKMDVNDTTYNFGTEVDIPFSLSPIAINTPTKAGYNYLFLSIPTDREFTLVDSLGTNIRSSFSIDVSSGTGGSDVRPGYYNNYIYKSSDVFSTAYSTSYTLTLL